MSLQTLMQSKDAFMRSHYYNAIDRTTAEKLVERDPSAIVLRQSLNNPKYIALTMQKGNVLDNYLLLLDGGYIVVSTTQGILQYTVDEFFNDLMRNGIMGIYTNGGATVVKIRDALAEPKPIVAPPTSAPQGAQVPQVNCKAHMFDFDLTLAKIHMYSEIRSGNTDIVNRPNDVFRPIVIEHFANFVKEQRAMNNMVGIISFGIRHEIQTALYKLNPELYATVPVMTPEIFGITSDLASVMACGGGANIKIEFMKAFRNVYMSQACNMALTDVILYDDDQVNIDAVRQAGMTGVQINGDNDLAFLNMNSALPEPVLSATSELVVPVGAAVIPATVPASATPGVIDEKVTLEQAFGQQGGSIDYHQKYIDYKNRYLTLKKSKKSHNGK